MRLDIAIADSTEDYIERASPNIRAANDFITMTADDVKFDLPTGLSSIKAMLNRMETIARQGDRDRMEVMVDSTGACNGGSASIKLNDIQVIAAKRDPAATSTDGLHAVAIDSSTHSTLWSGIWNTVEKPATG